MDTRDTGRMTPAPESPDAAREQGWRFQIVSDGDVRAYSPNGETWLVRAGTREPFLKFVHALFTHLATAPDTTRLTAERDAALRDAERWQMLYSRAVNEANALMTYVDHSFEWRCAESRLSAIEEEARAALSAQERGNV